MLDVLTLIVQGGAFALLAYLAVRGLPALLVVMGLYLKAQVHQDETLAKLTKAIIHLTYKIKNPQIANNEEMTDIEKELVDHMKALDDFQQNELAVLLKAKKPA